MCPCAEGGVGREEQNQIRISEISLSVEVKDWVGTTISRVEGFTLAAVSFFVFPAAGLLPAADIALGILTQPSSWLLSH